MINEIISGRRKALGEENFLESVATKRQTDEMKKISASNGNLVRKKIETFVSKILQPFVD